VFGQGQLFGDYELLEEIARGGMGVVYKARQVSLNRIVALKMILSGQFASTREVLRFRAEAEAAAHLRHPNIVAIFQTGECEGRHYFSMAYVPGRNLAEIVRDGPLPGERAAGYVQTLAEAIHYAHQQGILHRDLKPSNVLIDVDDQPRITDFGLAKRLQDDFGMTITGQVLGSPNFMPPEQCGWANSIPTDPDSAFSLTAPAASPTPETNLKSEITNPKFRVGPWSDVYGLGAILYHLVTGRPPFQADTISEVFQQLREREPVSPRLLNPSVPRDLETICLKCLEKEPVKRYPTAHELADELARFRHGEPIVARPVKRWEKAWRWSRRKPALAAALGTSLFSLLLVAIGLPIAVLRINAARSESERNRYVDNIHLANDALEAHDLTRTRLLLREIDRSPDQRSMREWAWRYLAGRGRGDELTTLCQHQGFLPALAASPDGKWLAAIGQEGKVMLWDFAARKEINSWPGRVNEAKSQSSIFDHDLVFVPDTNTLITTGPDKNIRLWEVPSGKKRSEIPLAEAATRLAVSRDGRWLAAGTSGGQLSLFSLASSPPSRLQTWDSDVPVLIDLRFTSDGLTLFAGGADAQTVRRYDLSDSASPRRLPDLEDSAGPLAVSPDGRWLATAQSAEQSVCLRTLPSLTPVATNSSARGESQINTFEFSPDSRVLAVGLKSGRIILWDIAQPPSESVTLLGHEADLARLAFSRDGRILASASYLDKTVRLWDAAIRERGKWTFRQAGSVRDVNFSPDSKKLVSISRATVTSGTNGLEHVSIVQLWTVDERQGLLPLQAVTNSTTALNLCASFSTDGNLVAMDDFASLNFLQVPTLTFVTRAGSKLPCFATNGQWLAYTDSDKILRSESPLHPATVLAQQNGKITALALSADGRMLASCAENEEYVIKLWNADTGHLIGELPGHQAWVNCLAFSSNGKTLASAGWDDGWLGIWDVPHRRLRTPLLRAHNGAVFKLAFSPDGATLATCGDDAAVRLWNVEQQREIALLPTHGGSVKGVAFSPDSHWLACACDDGVIHLWRAPSMEEATALNGTHGSRRR
jgi:WD40 repeat protein/tRNA A-37 threonylcarbamoyl transferase component Bud32